MIEDGKIKYTTKLIMEQEQDTKLLTSQEKQSKYD
jgi:hypothetical protein